MLKLKENEASLESPDDPSASSTLNERSQLLRGNEELKNVKERRPDGTIVIRFQRFVCRTRQPRNHGNEAREKIEMRAREFVQRARRKFHKSVP